MNVITSVTTTTTNAQVREYLTAARTYYVRTDGNDSNNGLANTPAGAFKTIQHAVDVVCTAIDINSQIVTIQVADDTYNYNAAVVLKEFVGTGPVWLQGNTSTPTNVPLNVTGASAIIATGGTWVIQGFSITTTGANSDGITADGAVRVTYTQVNFGSCGRYHVFGASGATVIGTGAYSISAGGYGHLGAGANARIGLNAATVTVTGTPAFTTFALSTFASTMEFYGTTFSGAATGKRYEATLNAVIYTSAGGANFFPGNSAGTTSTGGQYA
jgi:hypothetical protein